VELCVSDEHFQTIDYSLLEPIHWTCWCFWGWCLFWSSKNGGLTEAEHPQHFFTRDAETNAGNKRLGRDNKSLAANPL